MSYLDQSLGKNEVIVARARIAWIYTVAALACVLAGIGLAGVALGSGLDPFAADVLAGAAIVFGTILFFGILLPVWTTEVGVTNQRLIVKRGVLGRETEELQLWSVEEVDLKQSPVDRIVGFGRVVVAGTGEDAMTLPLISDALSFRKAVQEAINDARLLRQKP